MKNYSVFIFITLGLIFVLSSCKNLNIEKGSTKAVLEQFGKENPEKMVEIETKYGTIELELFEDTPLHRANFVRMIKGGRYKNADFYRIVSSFMIQGGNTELPKLNYTVPNEVQPKYFHRAGALAMARYDENNPQKESSATEFYIVKGRRYLDEDLEDLKNTGKYAPQQLQVFENEGGATNLDGFYTVFGQVTKGMDVVAAIAQLKTNDNESPKSKVEFKIRCY